MCSDGSALVKVQCIGANAKVQLQWCKCRGASQCSGASIEVQVQWCKQWCKFSGASDVQSVQRCQWCASALMQGVQGQRCKCRSANYSRANGEVLAWMQVQGKSRDASAVQ